MHIFSKNRALRIFFYCICICIFFEIVSRLFVSVDPFFQSLEKVGYNDSLRRLQWIKRHLKSRPTPCNYDVYSSTRGWTLKPNIRDLIAWDNKIVNSNSKGLRGKLEYSYNKPANKIRILILGDSFTFGEEVSDTETYSYYLQQLLPDVEVINLGVHAYGHDQMLLYFNEEGIKYKPDIVILGFVYDDMHRNILMFYDYAKPKFELVNNTLKLKNTPVPSPETIIKKEFYRSKFIDLLSILYYLIDNKRGGVERREKEITWAIFDEMIRTTNKIGAKLVFASLPAACPMNLPGLDEYLPKYCKNKNVYYISVYPYANANKSREFFASGRHWNANGHRIVAEAIKEYLLAQDIIKLNGLNISNSYEK